MADDIKSQLTTLFARPSSSSSDTLTLPADVLTELQSMLRLHAISPQELSYKWESFAIKMGMEQSALDIGTARAFKRDFQEMLEREARGKTTGGGMRSGGGGGEKKGKGGALATPRGKGKNSADVFGNMMSGMVLDTPVQSKSKSSGSVKRKSNFETPAVPKFNKSNAMSSPTDGRQNEESGKTPINAFSERQNAGQIIETLNDHLSACEAPLAPHAESRARLTANTDLRKFFYKPMAMHLSEASEILDDRIDEFQLLIQAEHGLEDSAFGSAAAQSTTEIIAVGRIASDSLEGKLNAASLVLEMSRRTGAGLRVPLKIDGISHEFFPGQIVGLRGINASGDYFSVKEVIEVPLLPPPASLPSALDSVNERMGVEDEESANPTHALNIMVAAGPYTSDDNVAFEPLNVLCETAESAYADVLVLIGPLLDLEHPLLASGDFDLPEDASIEPDKATLNDVFRIMFSARLRRLAEQVPGITILLIPSARDALNKHVSWPQEPFDKKALGLPKQAKVVTNPVTVSLNEVVVGICAHDVLNDLRREEVVVGKPKVQALMGRLPRHLIQQRHFYPIFPPMDRTALPKPALEGSVATGMPMDISYLKLGEWLNVRPDILIMPSTLPPSAKVIESVTVINPGPLSKRRGPGTYAQLAVHPRKITEEEREAEKANGSMVGHHLFERMRADIVRI